MAVQWLRFPRVVGVIAVVYFVVVAGYFAFETTRRAQFASDAEVANGVVVALEPRPIAGSTRVPTGGVDVPLAPQVRYVVGGQTFLYTASHGMIGSTIKVGDAVEVLYDPTNPHRAHLRGEGQILLPVITAGFGTVTLTLVAVLVLTRNRGATAGAGSKDPARPATRELEHEFA